MLEYFISVLAVQLNQLRSYCSLVVWQRTLQRFYRDYYVKRGGIFRLGERPAHNLPSNCKGHSRIIANYSRIIVRFIRYLAEIFLLPRIFFSYFSFSLIKSLSFFLFFFFLFRIVGISLSRNFLLPSRLFLIRFQSLGQEKKRKKKKRSFLININIVTRYFIIVQYLLS